MVSSTLTICHTNDCLLPTGHRGKHEKYPTSAWSFMGKKDRNKITKAGFATPRGGSKGAYQNHVLRSNRVIIPYEKLNVNNLVNYRDGYVVRLFPEQYFERKGVPHSKFLGEGSGIVVGENAFVLYRTHGSLRKYPPLAEWSVRHLERGGHRVEKRGRNVSDMGHYVLRVSSLGRRKGKHKGPPQGLFAPEYTDERTNYLCKCVLAWLIIHTDGSPHTTSQASYLELILRDQGLMDYARFENNGVLRHGLCCCPLCLRIIKYSELHEMLDFEQLETLENASMQVEGATRSTIVNLFHLEPLSYDSITHVPRNVAWGHAVCNTRLGQRHCLSLSELQQLNLKVGIITADGIETFAWISEDRKFIRSPKGGVWVQVSDDMPAAEMAGAR